MKIKTIAKITTACAVVGYVINLVSCFYIAASYNKEDLIKPAQEQCQKITSELDNIADLKGGKYKRYLIEEQKEALDQRVKALSGMKLKLESDMVRYTQVIEDWKKKAINPLEHFK